MIRQAASFAVDVFGIGLLEEFVVELHKALVWLLALPVAVVAALFGPAMANYAGNRRLAA